MTMPEKTEGQIESTVQRIVTTESLEAGLSQTLRAEDFSNILRTSAIAALDAELNSGATFGAALVAAARQLALVTNHHGFALSSDGEIARIVHADPGASRSATEAYWVAIALRLRCIAGLSEPLAAVRFAHPTPTNDGGGAAPFDALFGVDAEFDAPANELVFRSAILSMRLGFGGVDAGEERAPMSEAPASSSSALAGADRLIERLREEIARMLFEAGTPVRLGPLARKFAMSTRSLQRRLTERETSLSTLIEEVRKDRAIELLARRTSLAEIATQLRFASVPAFCRAFRHWTQTSPRAYQRALEQRPSGIYDVVTPRAPSAEGEERAA